MKLKLYFLGFDGLSDNILFNPAHKGRWPAWERLYKKGIYGKSLCETKYTFTGPSWTSIYTGQPAETHGITDLWGRPVEGSRSFRMVKNPYAWDILNAHNLSCGVVTMPITYPAKTINKFMISGFPSPKLSFTGDIKVSDDFIVDHSQTIRRSRKIERVGYSFHDRVSPEEDIEMLKSSELKKAEVVGLLLKQQSVDVLFVQYSCLDRIGHELNNYARRGVTFDYEKVLEMYDWVDRVLLPRVLGIESEWLVIVSDHGWQKLPSPVDTPRVWAKHYPGGVFMLSGADIPANILSEAQNIDILPTMLETLGIPVPKEITGRSVLTRQSEIDEVNATLEGLGYI